VETLLDFVTDAYDLGVPLYMQTEPDLGDEATALALAPSEAARLLVSRLPLALREEAVV